MRSKVRSKVRVLSKRDEKARAQKRLEAIDRYILSADTDRMNSHELGVWRYHLSLLTAERDTLVRRYRFP